MAASGSNTDSDNENISNISSDGSNTIDNDDNVRIGTISSARFNILSTMVGGGCLSLPLAFHQSGNALVGPLMLLLTGAVTDFCFRLLVASAVFGKTPNPNAVGKDTFESITSEAFGPKAYVVSMGLVVLMCFFGTVGYSVLLRDMMEPVNDVINRAIFGRASNSASFVETASVAGPASPWFHKNFTMFLVVVLVTPFCTLRRLTALKGCGAASMLSLLILGSCIVVRSVQCNCNAGPYSNHNRDDNNLPWYDRLQFFPNSWHDLLNALPLYISCFVCHYNILPVHNELKDPSPSRVSWWLRSTTWFAVALYMVMGLAGSAYAHCTPDGKIQGNILLDFDKNDPLLMVGRMCLAVTITLAFPMLVIPGRDIMIRSLILPRLHTLVASSDSNRQNRLRNFNNGIATGSLDDDENEQQQQLREPLLESGSVDVEDDPDLTDDNNGNNHDDESLDGMTSVSSMVLLSTSVVIFWSAAALASVVSSIDVVWDLLGSSLSILMSYLIPAGSYIVITNRNQTLEEPALHPPPNDGSEPQSQEDTEARSRRQTIRDKVSRVACWLLMGVSIPLMVASTVNAVYNTFF